MKHGRSKNARKTLKFFDLNGNTRPPYKIILDGNFLAAIVKQKVPLHDRLNDTLQREKFTLYVCRSALDELNLLPGEIFQKARQYGLDECEILERPKVESEDDAKDSNHEEGDKDKAKEGEQQSSPSQDIQHLLNIHPNHIHRPHQVDREHPFNPQGYIVATQDEELQSILRSFNKIPIMRIGRGVLMLESPSAASKRQSVWEERGKQISGGSVSKIVSEEERGWIEKIKAEQKQERLEDIQKAHLEQRRQYQYQDRKKRKAKNPNPLSCKKKKIETKQNAAKVDSDKKRKRRRKSNKPTSAEEGNA